jgi:hypothetical protein
MMQRLSFEGLTNLRGNSYMTRQYEYENNSKPLFSQGMTI